ncbi:DUF1330 domain-containing protein [Burkholderia glumae]|uniref:DUF1330 domain-containing protein n=1 Tax=Burkholderia glumae TaxID=337 RepID=UPI0021517E4F|nr:DUF1330 domain-containing protein [Burkholderia glumae]
MTAYIVFDIDVHDASGYEQYREIGAPTVAQFGGRFLVRGGEAATLEGGWSPRRIVVLEFDSIDRAKAWYESDAYRRARGIRERTARTTGIIVQGAAQVAAAGERG